MVSRQLRRMTWALQDWYSNFLGAWLLFGGGATGVASGVG